MTEEVKRESNEVPVSAPFQLDVTHLMQSLILKSETMIFPILQQCLVGAIKEYFAPILPTAPEQPAVENQSTKE
jgi:hypothetical protein